MSTEITMLTWSMLLGLAYVLIAAGFATYERGIGWNAGNRDGAQKPLSPMGDRAARASRNFLETFPFFAAAVLAIAVTHRSSPSTALGSQLYFWARAVYLPIYIVGVPYLRTAVWAVSLWGLLQLLEGLLQ